MKNKPLTYILLFLCIVWTASGPIKLWKEIGIESFDRAILIWVLGIIAFMIAISAVFKIEERKIKAGIENRVLGGFVCGAITLILAGIFLISILQYTKEGYPFAYFGIPGVLLLIITGLIQIKNSLIAKQCKGRYESFLK